MTIEIARMTIARGREVFSPKETLLLSPLTIIISGMSVFFTLFTSLFIIGPQKKLKGLPNPPITRRYAALYHFFRTSANPTSHMIWVINLSHSNLPHIRHLRNTLTCLDCDMQSVILSYMYHVRITAWGLSAGNGCIIITWMLMPPMS